MVYNEAVVDLVRDREKEAEEAEGALEARSCPAVAERERTALGGSAGEFLI